MTKTEPPLVLLVEDHPQLREIYADVLRDEGFRVEVAVDGIEGLGKATSVLAPDVVVVDLHLPKLDGLEVIRRLRAHPGTSRLPIIMFSSDHAAEDEARRAGCDAFLMKPSPLATLIEAIQRQLGRR